MQTHQNQVNTNSISSRFSYVRQAVIIEISQLHEQLQKGKISMEEFNKKKEAVLAK